MRTPVCLGHFEKVGALFQGNTMGPFWPNNIEKSKNAGEHGTQRNKSSRLTRFTAKYSYFLSSHPVEIM